ncbi:MAG: CotH kinase family protein [Spirochaetales bacterium]|nr:CotH kinase family protein [Spirochaetales bacterium]
MTLTLCLGFLLFLSSCALVLKDDAIDPLERQTENGLPVFYLHPMPKVTEYADTTLYYRGTEYRVQAKTRGESSLWYPMKSLTIMFPEDQLFSDSEYGFENKQKIILITSFDDNSCIRQRLAFDMWNRMDPAHIQVNTSSAVVYANGRYHGLYTVCDRIDADLMQSNGLDRNGNLYKTVTWDGDFKVKSDLHAGFEKKEGLPEHGCEGAFDDLDELIHFTDTSPTDGFAAGIEDLVNMTDFQNCWILLKLLWSHDSQVKNLYYYHTIAEKWKISPWDFNCSFGQDSQTYRIAAGNSNSFMRNRLFERIVSETPFQNLTIDRLLAYIDGGSLSLDWIMDRIDYYINEISGAAEKNEQEWAAIQKNFWIWDDRTDFTDFEGEIAYIRQWIAERYAWLLDNYN